MSWKPPPDTGLALLLQQRFELFGDQVAVEQGNRVVTFHELYLIAVRVAHKIHRQIDSNVQEKPRRSKPIPILAARGIDHIICQIAVVFAGGSCVPLDVDLPEERLVELINNLGESSLLLVDYQSRNRCLFTRIPRIVVDYSSQQADREVEHEQLEVATNGPASCSHIYHTSGSTGKPKAVQVLAQGLINLTFNEFQPLRRGQRLGHVCNIGFDVSMWEIWAGILHGATIVVFERDEILDASLMQHKLCEARIDVIWQTTSLLGTIAHICPAAYATVDTLLTGGEAINLQTIRRIFDHGPPRRLYNVYGPTELSVFSTYHLVSEADVAGGIIPIGRALSGYYAFVVDSELQAVPDGEVGELVVGGLGVAAGYLGSPERTAKVFVNAPHLGIPGNGIVNRTGDLVRRNSSEQLEYLGRRDNEVKIRGQRVELETVEHSLLETQLVSLAVALKVSEPWTGGGSGPPSSLLAAYVVPLSAGIDAKSISRAYRERVPHLMVPRLKTVDSISLTGSGKIDRKKLARDFESELQSTKLSTNGFSCRNLQPQLKDVGDRVRHSWAHILGHSPASLSMQDDFFSLGGTSLHAVHLLNDLNKSMGLSLRAATVFENPTLEGMSEAVSKLLLNIPAASASETSKTPIWIQDMRLGKDFQRNAGTPPNWQDESEGRVFLTGATGFVGAMLLAQLLAHPRVKAVACLIRARDESHARDRIRDTLSKYNLALYPHEEAKIEAVAGDLSQPDLGFGEEQYRHYAQWSSVVFHLAAHVNYIEPYSTHRPANVAGTLNAILFSQAHRSKSLHYTSSISAYGPTGLVTGTRYLAEDERPQDHMLALEYDTGYAQSKFTAETIVWTAIDAGLPIAIYRLGAVLGHTSGKGLMHANPADFLTRLVKTCIQQGVYPCLPDHKENIVPVDFVVSSLMHISSRTANLHRAYNVVHPHQCTLDFSTVFQSISSRLGIDRLREVPYREWIEVTSKTSDNPLTSLLPMLSEPVRDGLSRWEMQRSAPEFSIENLHQVLADSPEILFCPPPSAMLDVYISCWIHDATAQEGISSSFHWTADEKTLESQTVKEIIGFAQNSFVLG
jgi:amino acid adenylation domain-containing protein/thioester reductase-like protein